jgi:hypothetical protein
MSEIPFGGDMAKRQLRFLTVMTALIGIFALAVPLRAQSLAELAKKEKERREKVQQKSPGATRTITDDDLKAERDRARARGTEVDAAEAAGGESAPASEGTGSGTAASEGDRDSTQSYWDERVSTARDDVAQAQARLNEAQAAAQASRGALSSSTYDDAADEAAARKQVQDDYETAKQELATAQRTLADVEREAQRSGAQVGGAGSGRGETAPK